MELARHNAALAEVDDVVRFDVDDARHLPLGRAVRPGGHHIPPTASDHGAEGGRGALPGLRQGLEQIPRGLEAVPALLPHRFERTFGKKRTKSANSITACSSAICLCICNDARLGRRRRPDAGKGGRLSPPYFYHQPRRRKRETTRRLEEQLSRLSVPHEVFYTREAGEARKIAERAAAEGAPARLYACGGDGTLNEVVNGAAGHDFLAVTNVPKGTGNDFLKLFGPGTGSASPIWRPWPPVLRRPLT